MVCGWTGKILKVDLTSGEISIEDTMEYAHDFIGGVGLSAKIFWDLGCPKVNAFDHANPLIISTGPLTGTLSPSSGRAEVCSISPHTYPNELYTYSGFGGKWPAVLKFAGYDAIVIVGKSEEPVYLSVHDGDVAIKSAGDLWGLDTFETQRVLESREPDSTVLCIGPAGENLCRSAIILTGTSHASGGAGFGAVMGSKKLKAIAVAGTGGVKVARPTELMELCSHIEKELGFGTFSTLATKGSSPITPTHDGIMLFETGTRTAKELVNYKLKRASGCYACPLQCDAVLDVPGVGKGAAMCSAWVYAECGIRGPGEEGDTSYYTGEDKPTAPAVTGKPAWEANMLTQKLGINQYDILWNFMGWIWHCYKRGILSEKDTGLPTPEWLGGRATDHEFLTSLIEGVAYGKSPFAQGIARAAEHFGKEALEVFKEFSATLGFVRHWNDAVPGCLHWALETRDPFNSCHDYSQMIGRPEVSKYAFGTEGPAYSMLKDPVKAVYEGSDMAVLATQNRQRIKNSLPVCDWAFPVLFSPIRQGVGDTSLESKLYSAVTGIDTTEEELYEFGEKIVNLDRAIAVKREDRTRENDTLYNFIFEHRYWGEEAWHLGNHWYGPLDREKFEGLKDNYYRLRGWDVKTGRPSRDKLEKLGLGYVADELEDLGKIK